jgi:DnaJ domain
VRTSSLAAHFRQIDLYGILEVNSDATPEAIRRAYRRGALTSHPDRHPNDKQAAERFLLLTQARDILLNPATRVEYDQLRQADSGQLPPIRHGFSSAPGRRTVRRNAADPLDEHRLAGKAQQSRSAAELTLLWRVNSTVVRASILRNVSCPIALYNDPCVVEHWMLGLEAANRAGCPVEVLDKLAFSFERCVALAVASHPAASSIALNTIAARHRDLPILHAIAVHRNADQVVLREVGRSVRGPRTVALGSAVLSHPACPADVAQRIRSRLGAMVA